VDRPGGGRPKSPRGARRGPTNARIVAAMHAKRYTTICGGCSFCAALKSFRCKQERRYSRSVGHHPVRVFDCGDGAVGRRIASRAHCPSRNRRFHSTHAGRHRADSRRRSSGTESKGSREGRCERGGSRANQNLDRRCQGKIVAALASANEIRLGGRRYQSTGLVVAASERISRRATISPDRQVAPKPPSLD
jgi:hypothetical protein